MSNFESCLSFTLRQESGLVFNPVDPGGVTNFGISVHLLSQFKGKVATADDIRALTLVDVKPIYFKLFWQALNLDRFEAWPALQLSIFDFAVNSGADAAARTLQNVLTCAAQPVQLDGVLGQATIAAIGRVIAESSEIKLCLVYSRARRMLMARICQRDRSQIIFLAGWIGRTHALDDAMSAVACPQP